MANTCNPCWRWFGMPVRVLGRVRRRWLRFIRKISFHIVSVGSLDTLRLGKGVHFEVPVHVRGGRGALELSDGIWLGWEAAPRVGDGAILLQPRSPESVITIGMETALSNNVSIISMAAIRIGQRCLIGDMVQIFDCDFHELDPQRRHAGAGPIEPVQIGDNVWLGSRVMVLRGVTIGDNSVIAAGSIVTRPIPANSLAAGTPARIIRAL